MGLYWCKKNGNYYSLLCYKYMGCYWGYIAILEKKMETTILGLGVILGYGWGNRGIFKKKGCIYRA